VADIVPPAQDAMLVRRKKRNPGARIGGESVLNRGSALLEGTSSCSALEKAPKVIRSAPAGSVCGHASTVREQLVEPLLSDDRRCLQPWLAIDVSGSDAVMSSATPCRALGGVESVMRAQAVAATTMAAATAIACCQPCAGTAMCATPSAA
jgi:hypothetical protein